MTQHLQQPLYRFEATGSSDPEYDQLCRNLGYHNDSAVGIAYAISEWAITWLGPVFWICLLYLLIVAEFGN